MFGVFFQMAKWNFILHKKCMLILCMVKPTYFLLTKLSYNTQRYMKPNPVGLQNVPTQRFPTPTEELDGF